MIVSNLQQNILIDHPFYIKNIGIKLSGGADSSIICYILSKYISEERPDITLIPITVDHAGKAYQIIFAKKIINFCKENFGNIFGKHYTDWCPSRELYIETQDKLLNNLYKQSIIDCHYVGITKNPPHTLSKTLCEPIDDRSPIKIHPTKRGETANLPLVNIDKKGVCELYRKFNLLNTLLPLTRSCENFTDNFSFHCNKCWYCLERNWGFDL